MRTEAEVKANIASIREAMKTIKNQIFLLENEYQANSLETTGEIVGSWEDMIERLDMAWDDLNTMYHMEIDVLFDDREED